MYKETHSNFSNQQFEIEAKLSIFVYSKNYEGIKQSTPWSFNIAPLTISVSLLFNQKNPHENVKFNNSVGNRIIA